MLVATLFFTGAYEQTSITSIISSYPYTIQYDYPATHQ